MMRAAASAGLDMLRPSHLTVLRVLDPRSQGMRISDLARDADVSRQAIQQVVDDLERLGIVESKPDRDDRRARRVRYTPTGRRGYDRCMSEFSRLECELEAEIGASAIRRLKRDLAKLAARSQTFR
jgi:DNA-binding MarR family transcriptional regulator